MMTMNGRDKALDGGLLWMRVLTGLSIAFIGYGKVFGGQAEMLAQGLTQMGFPLPGFFAWVVALTEFGGGLLIALGLGTRISSLFLLVTMCVAFFVAHARDPFSAKIPAFTYGILAGGLLLTGAGRFSLDALLCRRCCKKTE